MTQMNKFLAEIMEIVYYERKINYITSGPKDSRPI